VSLAESLFEVNNSEFGVNLGGGRDGFVSEHVGFRGDVRYFRQLSDPEEDNEFDIGLGDLDDWRATAGIPPEILEFSPLCGCFWLHGIRDILARFRGAAISPT